MVNGFHFQKRLNKLQKVKTTEKFIGEAKKVHGDKYNYSLVDYKKALEKIVIICKIHGKFVQTPDNHLHNHGCQTCSGNVKYTKRTYVREARKAHGNKYKYLSEYINALIKVKIECKKCGNIVELLPSSHLQGHGCSKCSYAGNAKKRSLSNKDFIVRANEIHNNGFIYLEKYTKGHKNIELKCKKCGFLFKQDPASHLQGIGCPHCRVSKGEKSVRKWLDQNKIIWEKQKRFKTCKSLMQLPFDFYCRDFKLLIEYDGHLHFKPFNMIKNKKKRENAFKDQKKRDGIKTKWSEENGYNLLRISYKQNVEEELNKYFKVKK
jgi:very-short-patch-repair endonuclease